MKEFTWYPRELQPKFKKVRARRTIMSKKEKKLPAFQRPKRWFKKAHWKLVKKFKVFGFTASNGKSIFFPVPPPWDADVWAVMVKKTLAPWLEKTFAGKTSFTILLDGGKIAEGTSCKEGLCSSQRYSSGSLGSL